MAPKFLRLYSVLDQTTGPICIHCDSQDAIGRDGSVMYTRNSRHIRQRHSCLRLLSSGIITIDYVKSENNVSYPFTKGLTRDKVKISLTGMRLWPRTSHLGGNFT